MGVVPDSDLPDSTGQQAVPESDIPDQLSSSAVPPEDLPSDEGDDSLLRQAGAGAEGLARGLVGPVATAAELGLSKMGVPGLSAEEQSKREADYPMTHAAGEVAGFGVGLLGGTTEARLAVNAGEHLAGALLPEATTIAGKIGSAFIKNATQGAILQGGDEMSKAMLGQGDPEAPVASSFANTGVAALLTGLVGAPAGIFASDIGAKASAAALEDSKIGVRMKDFLAGIGDAAKPGTFFPEGAAVSPSFDAGQKFYREIPKYLAKAGTAYLGDKAIEATGLTENSPTARVIADRYLYDFISPKMDALVGRVLTPTVEKMAVPVVMNALSKGETAGIYQALDHVSNVAKGSQKISKALGALFVPGTQKAYDLETSDKDREKIKQYFDDGGLSQQLQNQPPPPAAQSPEQGFAKGGHVSAPPLPQKVDGMAVHFPDQCMVLGAAKGRISNYLNSLRPQSNLSKPPFDADPDQKPQEKKYNKAIDLAVNPLSILNKVKDGSLSTDDMAHFTALHPELHRHLSKGITEKIIKEQLAGTKPHYKTRQGLSLFMGANLDSTFNPINIQAAQSVFSNQRAQGSAAGQTKHGTSKLGDAAKQSRTSQEAAVERQTNEK